MRWVREEKFRGRIKKSPATRKKPWADLVEIDVHDVNAKITGAGVAHESVEVGAIHVEVGACLVDEARHLRTVRLEHADSGRVGQHERGDITCNTR